MTKERDVALEVLPKMINYFQEHRFKKPVLSVMPKDRNDNVRDSMEAIAKQWDSKYDDTDYMQLSSIMGEFMDAIAWMPEERRRYIVGEIRKYRDIENPTAMISGKNMYGYHKSRLDGGLYKRKQMNKPNWDKLIALLLMDMMRSEFEDEMVGTVDRDLPYEYQMDRVKEVK